MKRIFIVIITCALFCLTGCASNKQNQEQNSVEVKSSDGDSGNSVDNNNIATVTAPKSTISSEKLEKVKDYSIKKYERSKYTYHIVVVKNNNDVQVEVNSNTKVYDADGNMIGADSGCIDVLGPGCTSVLVESIEDINNAAKFETTLTATEASYYNEINTFVKLELNATTKKVFVTLTNNGEKSAKFVKAYVIFLDSNGNAVDYEDTYITGADNEIKPGESITEEIKTDKEFASAEVYIDGYAYNE